MSALPSESAIEFAILEIGDYGEKMHMATWSEMACSLAFANHVDRLRDAVEGLANAASDKPQTADQIRAAMADLIRRNEG